MARRKSMILDMNAGQEGGDRALTLTVEEAAAALGVSRGLAYEAVRLGQIPSIKIGRRLLVPRAALSAMLESAARPSDSDGNAA
jgi:excisionase family DNA binding protein